MDILYSRRGGELIALAERGRLGQRHDDMERLDRELIYGPRLAMGALATFLGVLTAVLIALAEGTQSDPLTLFARILAVPAGLAAAWLGLAVVKAGHRVVSAYVAMTPEGGGLRLMYVLPLMWATGGLVRPTFTGISLAGFTTATSLLSVSLRSGDPAGLGDAVGAATALGLICSVVFAISTACLLGGDLRIAVALAKGVGRARP